MRRLLLFALLLLPQMLVAQEICYYPDKTMWEELQVVEDKIDPEWYIRLRYTVEGDTLVGDVNYKRVKRQWMEGQEWAQYTQAKTFYLREDNGLVYFLGKNYPDSHSYDDIVYDGSETLRYNFNWEIGGLGALGKGTLKDFSQIELADGNLYDYDSSTKVIRTIGCIRGGLLLPCNSARSMWFALASFTRNGVEIYHKDFPATNGIESVNTTSRGKGFNGFAKSLFIYDLSGRRVVNSSEFQGSNKLPKGVYIQNGKKFVVK